MLEALQGQSPTDVAAVMNALTVAANQQPELAGVFSTYAANTPQIYLDIDRDKAQVLGVKISDIFNALQSTLGSYYVNDFNVFGRTWQVNIQADTQFRDQISDIDNIYVRNAKSNMVPMRALAEPSWSRGRRPWCAITAIAPLSSTARRNRRRAPARRSPPWSVSRPRLCRPAFSYEWTGTALQEKTASGHTASILGFAVLFAYLFLVALYESWNIPISALAVRQRRDPRRGVGGCDRRTKLRRLCPDRTGGPDRARRQERHSDRRICGPTARTR